MALNLYNELVSNELFPTIEQYIINGNDAAIVAVYNKENILDVGDITWAEFATWLLQTSVRADIEEWKTHIDKWVRALAFTLLDGLQSGRVGTINIKQFEPLLINLVVAGLLSETNRLSLIALATKNISKAQQLGITINNEIIAQTLRG